MPLSRLIFRSSGTDYMETMFEIEPIVVGDVEVSVVGVADDKAAKRDALAESVENACLTPLPLDSVYDSQVAMVRVAEPAQAVLSDMQFGHGEYAPGTGAEFLALCYDAGKAVILTTAYHDLIHQIRPYRHKIPVVLPPDEDDPEVLRQALLISAEEVLLGKRVQGRVPLRSIVEVGFVDMGLAHLFIPSWDPDLAVAFPVTMFSHWTRPVQDGDVFFALCNTGAREPEELFLYEIEPPSPSPTVRIPYDLQ